MLPFPLHREVGDCMPVPSEVPVALDATLSSSAIQELKLYLVCTQRSHKSKQIHVSPRFGVAADSSAVCKKQQLGDTRIKLSMMNH